MAGVGYWVLGFGMALSLAGNSAFGQRGKTTKPAAKPKAVIAAPSYRPRPVATKFTPHGSVAFSPDGKTMVVGTYGAALVFNAATGAPISRFAVGGEAVRALAFSADGAKLAVAIGVPGGKGAVALLDVATGKTLRTIGAHTDTIESVAFLGDSQILCASSDETVGVCDLSTGKAIATLTEHIGRCLCVAVPARTSDADGGSIFATGGADRMVKVWDANLRRVVVNFDQCQSPIWSLVALPRAGRFAAGGADGVIRVFGVRADGRAPISSPNLPAPRAGFVALTLTGHDGPVYALAASPDSRFLLSGGADRKAIVWNPGNGAKLRELADATGDIAAVAISPDSKLAAVSSLDGRTRVYDLNTFGLVATLGAVATPGTAATPGAAK